MSKWAATAIASFSVMVVLFIVLVVFLWSMNDIEVKLCTFGMVAAAATLIVAVRRIH